MSIETLRNNELGPQTAALEARFMSPNETLITPQKPVTERRLQQLRRMFTLGSDEYLTMWSHSQHLFESEFTTANVLADRMAEPVARMPVRLELKLPLFGARDYFLPELQMNGMNHGDEQKLPGWITAKIKRPTQGASNFELELIESIKPNHKTSNRHGQVRWDDAVSTMTKYAYTPGQDTAWRKSTNKTFRTQSDWRSNDAMCANRYGRAMSVIERNVPFTDDDYSHANQLYANFWEAINRVEKLAESKSSLEYMHKYLGLLAASREAFPDRIMSGSDFPLLRRIITGKSDGNPLSGLFSIRYNYPVLDLDNPEHRELYEELVPRGEAAPDEEDYDFVDLDGVDGLFDSKWPN